MAIEYNIYKNNGAGGPVDLSAPVATVSALTWDSAPLAAGSDTTFLVRAHDTVTGLEDRNGDARARVRIDAAGADATGRPNAPAGLTASATAGGGCAVAFTYPAGGQGGAPAGFHVYLGTPTVSYTTPAATVPYDPSPGKVFRAGLTGLADGVAYRVGARAYNAAGEEQNAATAAVTGRATGPAAVDALAASVVP